MLRSIRSLEGYRIRSREERIGRFRDAYLDDGRWQIRYFVADTGGGSAIGTGPDSSGRGSRPTHSRGTQEVYVASETVLPPDDEHSELPVQLPAAGSTCSHDNRGWPQQSSEPLLSTGGGPVPFTSTDGIAAEDVRLNRDPHLCSARELRGYILRARDGDLGHLVGFLCDDQNWRIAFLVGSPAEAAPEEDGTLLIAPTRVKRVDWDRGAVHLDLSRAEAQRETNESPTSW
jgi:hypothetical protein